MQSEFEGERIPENVCDACPIEQDCCTHLSGLKLTEPEFQRLFASFREQLRIRRIGPIYAISVKNHGSCPNWKGRCSVYANRAVECKLFPYTIGHIRIGKKRVRISYHSRTNCPFKSRLLSSREEAEALISSFAREAFGSVQPVKIEYETAVVRFLDVLAKVQGIGLFFKRKAGFE